MSKEINLKYYKDEDILYLNLKEGPEYKSVEISPDVTVELGKNSEIIGIEILNASKHFKNSVVGKYKNEKAARHRSKRRRLGELV
jgi:uncharacterized protein YuzE